jgi:hypothetical protein
MFSGRWRETTQTGSSGGLPEALIKYVLILLLGVPPRPHDPLLAQAVVARCCPVPIAKELVKVAEVSEPAIDGNV